MVRYLKPCKTPPPPLNLLFLPCQIPQIMVSFLEGLEFSFSFKKNHNFNKLLILYYFNGTAECTAADAFKHAGDYIVFGSGSPFQNVVLGIYMSNSFSIKCF